MTAQYLTILELLSRNVTISILVVLFTTIVWTRIHSTRNAKVQLSPDGGPTIIPTVPYWIPVIGHIPSMAINAETFVRGLRSIYRNGIFALNFGGSKHNILYSPSLVTALFAAKSHQADSERVAKHITATVFGWPDAMREEHNEVFEELTHLYKLLLTEPSLGQMVARTVKKCRENVLNLVSFNESEIDQMRWEKTSDAILVEEGGEGEPVVEANLLPLIRDFCATTANESIMGPDFLANFPEFFDDLWIMDRAFLLLVLGLPRWLPIPSVTAAHLANERNLQRLEEFHVAMDKWARGEDPGTKWGNLDDVGGLVRARIPVYRKHNLSMRGRAGCENALMWAANANSNTLIFWIINRIYADRALLSELREEIAPFAEITQPDSQGLPISEPATFSKFDIDGICSQCPVLKSCYVECLRLDAAPWSFKEVQEDFVLQSREKNSPKWQLKKGEFIHAAHDLHSTDPSSFEDPNTWKAHRHIRYDEENKRTADMGSIRPYGGGSNMCKGRAFAYKEVMLFVAAIIAMWEIEPAKGGPWVMPTHLKSTGVYNTRDNTRVRIRRRKL